MANFVEGDTESALRVICMDNANSSVIDLNGTSVKLRWKNKMGVVKLKDMNIIDPVKGIAQYQFDVDELEPPEMVFDVIITNNVSNKVITCESLVKVLVRHHI
jgi:archaellin